MRTSPSILARALLVASVVALLQCSALETHRLPRLKVTVGGVPAEVEVASRPQTRARGLMYRAKLGPNQGMLFVYPTPRKLAYWMKNTLIPLDIGYFDGDGFLIEVHAMHPQPKAPDEKLRTYISSEPARFALEMNLGWYKRHNLKRYARLKLPREIAAVDD